MLWPDTMGYINVISDTTTAGQILVYKPHEKNVKYKLFFRCQSYNFAKSEIPTRFVSEKKNFMKYFV